jgi:hypothetical protein
MNSKSPDFPYKLLELAKQYVKECEEHVKETTAAYKIVELKDRKLPTIDYFIHIWLPKHSDETLSNSGFYKWLHSEDHIKVDCIKKIQTIFKALATDIVANEGKGIFYAKNALNMTDHQTTDSEIKVTIVRNNEH